MARVPVLSCRRGCSRTRPSGQRRVMLLRLLPSPRSWGAAGRAVENALHKPHSGRRPPRCRSAWRCPCGPPPQVPSGQAGCPLSARARLFPSRALRGSASGRCRAVSVSVAPGRPWSSAPFPSHPSRPAQRLAADPPSPVPPSPSSRCPPPASPPLPALPPRSRSPRQGPRRSLSARTHAAPTEGHPLGHQPPPAPLADPTASGRRVWRWCKG